MKDGYFQNFVQLCRSSYVALPTDHYTGRNIFIDRCSPTHKHRLFFFVCVFSAIRGCHTHPTPHHQRHITHSTSVASCDSLSLTPPAHPPPQNCVSFCIAYIQTERDRATLYNKECPLTLKAHRETERAREDRTLLSHTADGNKVGSLCLRMEQHTVCQCSP